MYVNSRIVKVKDLVPYEDNNRIITSDAVKAVALSIQTYGYNVPILIDTDNVILAGHVRRLALLKLGIDEVSCMVVDETDEVVKDKIRLLDNAISEAAEWDNVKLGHELRLIQDLGTTSSWDTFSGMFTKDSPLDMLLSNSLGDKIKQVGMSAIKRAEAKEDSRFSAGRTNSKDRGVVCPKCGKSFLIRVYGE